MIRFLGTRRNARPPDIWTRRPPPERPSRARYIALAIVVVGLAAAAIVAAVHGHSATARSAVRRPCGNPGTPSTVHHVVWIWLENHSYSQVVGAAAMPRAARLAGSCGLAADFHNESHGSLSNYLAATSGRSPLRTRLIDDCLPSARCSDGGDSIFAQAAALPGGWRTYAESMPVPCYRTNHELYAVRHNPAAYYPDLAGCASFDVPMGDAATMTGPFYTDVRTGNLPSFAFVAPNLRDDAHNGSSALADTWLARTVRFLTAGPNYRSGDTVVFVTADEGCDGACGRDYALGENCADPAGAQNRPSCHVPTLVVAPHTIAGTIDRTFFTHYSMLRTTEELLGLPVLGLARDASSMRAAFHLGPAPRGSSG